MDDNAGHMEGDVSSTTQDVPVTESRRMEVTVEVLKASDDEDMNFSTSSTGNPTSIISSPTKKPTTPTKESPVKSKQQETPIKAQIEEPQPSSATSPSKDELKTPKKTGAISICQIQAVTPTSQVKVFISPKSTIKYQGITEDVSPTKIKILQSPVNTHKDSPTKVKSVQSQGSISKDVNDKAASTSGEPISTSTTLSPQKPSAEISTTEDQPDQTKSTNNKEVEHKDSSEQPQEVSNSTDGSKMDIDKDNSTISQSICDDTSNDSQQSGIDKETGKNISRELKSLIKSAKDSKIISECTQLTSKIRKSRVHDTSIGSANTSLEAEKLQTRRTSDISQKSNGSEKSDKLAKRSMRSHNPEFVSKNKQFLNLISGKADTDDTVEEKPIQTTLNTSSTLKKQKITDNKIKNVEDKTSPKVQSSPELPGSNTNDPFCWRCHWAVEQTPSDKGHAPFHCNVCPRTYHHKCLTVSERTKVNENNLACPECSLILQAESSDTRSPAMKKINVAMLSELLNYAWQRMIEVNGVEQFMSPVDRTTFPEYDKYVVHPMDLKMMKENIAAGRYGSTEAFMADAQWILHNSIIFNTHVAGLVSSDACVPAQSKLSAAARTILRTCRTEMVEVEACPECYLAAHARRPTWFTDVCSTPHILLWAKLKGFPYWPAKGMSVNNSEQVDVRFFGAHDRAWVPAKDCYLYSEKDPNNFRTKRQDLINCQQEAEQYIRNLSRKFGQFQFPEFRISFNPAKMTEQLKMMIPGYQGEGPRLLSKEKSVCNTPSPASNKPSRSRSKSSKDSINDVESSDVEVEDSVADKKRKLTEKNDDKADDTSNKKAKTKHDVAKKRPRSELEEAVMTVIDDVPNKRRRLASVEMVVLEKSTTVGQKKNDENNTKDKQNKDPKISTPPKDKDSKSSKPSSIKKSSTPKIVFKLTKKSPSSNQKPKLRASTEKQKTGHKDEKKTTDKNTGLKDEKKTADRNTGHKDEKKTADKNTGHKDEKKITDKSTGHKDEKKTTDKNITPTASKDKKRESVKETEGNKSGNKSTAQKAKSVAERIVFDDDNTSLAVIARKSLQESNKEPGLPTISNVVSLSTNPTQYTTINKNTEATNVSGSTVYSHKKDNSKDAQKNPIGRVGVKAFARMPLENQSDVRVEVKSEPMELDDPDRQSEKIQMLNTFHLRPVNQPNLREIRINKVTTAPPQATSSKPTVSKAKAKKTFPQPKKSDDRSGLNSKNSMVYIPIQPPITQAPSRPQGRVQTASSTVASPPTLRTSTSNNMVNTLTTPVMTVVSMPPTISTTTTSMANMNQMAALNQLASVSQVPGLSQISNLGQLSSVGPVPSSVHTVPLLTSLNGQWTFSLQPMMSVGGVDSTCGGGGGGLVNGDRPAPPALAPLNLPSARPNDTNTDASRIVPKPPNPMDPNSIMGDTPAPSAAGPVTTLIVQNSVKLVEYFRQLLTESLVRTDDPSALITSLKLQLEQIQWKHKQELDELKHNHELMLSEVRLAMEKEKQFCIAQAQKTFQTELDAAITTTKSKQWCAYCLKEAKFYCCWNTSYCDYPCQRAHWSQHYNDCSQNTQPSEDPGTNTSAVINKISDSVTVKTPTNRGKLVPAPKVYRTTTGSQGKPSIVVSLDDKVGNTVKCVNLKKTSQISSKSPLHNNKQHDDSANKKVSSSGGYIIVGGNNSSPPSVVID